MMNLFKQLWPVIKSKVKDPTILLRTINSVSGGQGTFEGEDNFQNDQQNEVIAEL